MRPTQILTSLSLLVVALGLLVVVPVADAQSEAEGLSLNPDSKEFLEVFNRTFREEVTAGIAHVEAIGAATPSMLPGTASNLRDLLSLFVAGLDLGELSGEGENLVLALNPEFFDWGRLQGSGMVTLREAKVSERVLMALPEEVREARGTALLKGLNEFDDFEIGISWAWESSAIGRDTRDYRALTNALANQMAQELSGDFDTAMQRLLRLLDQGEQLREELVMEAARAQAQGLVAEQAVFRDNKLFRVGELISNQPQFYADFTGRFRDEILGQDDYGLSVTYEGGVANINGLLRKCASARGAGDATREARMANVSASCYRKFLDDYAEDWSKRWKVKVEYSETQSDSIELPDDDLVLDLASAHTFRAMGGLGFDLKPLPEVGNSPPRLDFEVKYENVSDSAVRSDDRLVGSMTFTQKLTDGTSASLGVVYANKPELLGEVDENLSARIGLKFNLDTGVKK